MPKATFVLIALLLVRPLDAAAEWTTLRSANFTYIGDASEREIRDVARRIERFRDAMTRVLPGIPATSPVPTVVIVFKNGAAFRPFMPLTDGRVNEVAGYFQSGRDVNYIALDAGRGAASYPTIFHEYTHFLNRNVAAGEFPVWLSEGLAGVYETFEEQNGGRSALIGRAQRSDLQILEQQTMLSLAELNAVGHASPIYGGDRRRGLFYAQSWALTHYLMIGSKERGPHFRDYLARLDAGEPSATALPAAFGDLAVLQRELRAYARQSAFTAYRFDFSEKLDGAPISAAEKIADYDAQGYLGDLLARIRGAAAGRAYLQKVLAASPSAARATAALGYVELRESNTDAAIPLLEKATAASPDDAGYQAALGRALFSRVQGNLADTPEEAALKVRARRALARAWELRPTTAEVAAMLGYLEDDLSRASTLMKEAIALEPSREDYRLLLANLLARNRDLDGATDVLGRLAARGSTPEMRARARVMLAQVADAKRQRSGEAFLPPVGAEPSAATADSPAVVAPSTSETPPISISGPRVPGDAEVLRIEVLRMEGSPTLIPLRPIGPGEARVLGVFVAIDCSEGRITLAVQTDLGARRFSTRSLANIDFISYRPTTPGSVNCGPQQLGRVYATYRAAPPGTRPQVDGEVVAIELLPEGAIVP
jgi:Flp pilus assembly protein TadD